jgi:hypothetical protein
MSKGIPYTLCDFYFITQKWLSCHVQNCDLAIFVLQYKSKLCVYVLLCIHFVVYLMYSFYSLTIISMNDWFDSLHVRVVISHNRKTHPWLFLFFIYTVYIYKRKLLFMIENITLIEKKYTNQKFPIFYIFDWLFIRYLIKYIFQMITLLDNLKCYESWIFPEVLFFL